MECQRVEAGMTTPNQASPSTSIIGERKFAVLLLAHGTPDTVDEIPEYLKNVVSGRAMPQHVVEEIQSRYAQIGKSPLTEWTLKEAELLQQKIGLPVYVGMRNWKPYIGDTVRQMRADGVTDAVAICLAPQNSRTSVGLLPASGIRRSGKCVSISLHRCVGRPSSTGRCVCGSIEIDLERGVCLGGGTSTGAVHRAQRALPHHSGCKCVWSTEPLAFGSAGKKWRKFCSAHVAGSGAPHCGGAFIRIAVRRIRWARSVCD